MSFDVDGPYANLFDDCRQHGFELEMHVSGQTYGAKGKEYRKVVALKVTRLGQPKGDLVASVPATLETLDESALALVAQLGW